MSCLQSHIDTDKNENEIWIMDDESFSLVSRIHLKLKWKDAMINLLLHKEIENTVTIRPPDFIRLHRPIIPRGTSFHHGVPAPCPMITHPFYFLVVWQSILSLTYSHQESVGHWSTWFFLSLQIPFHPSSCFVPLEADINELNKSGFIDIWPQYDFSQ